MKIDIKNVEKKQGIVFKKVLHGVQTTVTFSEEEKAIIEERKLKALVLLDRGVPSDVDDVKHANRGIAMRLATAAIKGADANNFNLTINKLLKGPDTYYLFNAHETGPYIEEIKEGMRQLKHLLTHDDAEDESFEL
jgi:hypothetical protein